MTTVSYKLRSLYENDVFRYGVAGVVNTTTGYFVFLFFFYVFDFDIHIANTASYMVGFVQAFLLNRVFVFRKQNLNERERSRFFLNKETVKQSLLFFGLVLMAFALNQIVLYVSHVELNLHPMLAQGLAMFSYTVFTFVGSKFYVFKIK